MHNSAICCLFEGQISPYPFHNLYRLQTDCNHLPNQPDNVSLIVCAVRVILNATSFVLLNAILVNHPFQSRPIPKLIVKHRRGNPIKRQGVVVDQLRFAFGQLHLLHTPIDWCVRLFDEIERMFLHLFITDMDLPQPLPRFGKPPEIRAHTAGAASPA